jgi:hypothetical protein
MCRVVDTMLIDQETIYASRHGNDRPANPGHLMAVPVMQRTAGARLDRKHTSKKLSDDTAPSQVIR